MNNYINPIIFIGLDFVWWISSVIVLLLPILVLRSFTKLIKYPRDRRKHFYPLQTIVIITCALLLMCDIIFVMAGHQPPVPLFKIPVVFVRGLALICLLIMLGQIVFQRQLPLTESQKRYRRENDR